MPVGAIIQLVSKSVELVTNLAKLKEARDAAKAKKTQVRNTTIVAIPYQVDTTDKGLRMLLNEKDLRSCISLFNEGLGMLMVALNRIRERPESCDRMAREENVLDLGAVVCDVFSAVLNELKIVSKESFEWAKSSFKSAREDATRAYVNEALNTEKRLLAAMVRILSSLLGCLDEPETAVAACQMYLKELNDMPCVSQALMSVLREINHDKSNGLYEKEYTNKVLTTVVNINCIVFHFTEARAKHLLHYSTWPRLKVSSTISVHPIRSAGLRALTDQTDQAQLEIHSESIFFNESIDATDMAVNSAGDCIVLGLNNEKNTVVRVYNNVGEFRFEITPPEAESSGANVEFTPRAVFTDSGHYIYLHVMTSQASDDDDSSSLFVFNEEGAFQRIISVKRGYMALEKNAGRIFISNRRRIFIYENNGELSQNFAIPGNVHGSFCQISVCGMNTLLLTSTYDSNVYLLNHSGSVKQQFEVGQARGWKFIAFNHISKELIVSYLSKDLTNFQLDAFLENGQPLGTVQLPRALPSHPRSMLVTMNGQIAILYENSVHLL
ncbi:uncharacterized protein LOC114520144 isoform X2 [Dendronephthya gigantea]|uniref:uncharacterized protein LOC114520144 isoform X2 n=1 Tax=Dendronephthya gigantea TaxID=151771 RepID=UPI00106A55B2|nr:uncharacterized protein LOC114520144 isoform X2 [Dendronephthya gigantea]